MSSDSTRRVLYLDSSAIVKLAVHESDTSALAAELARVASALELGRDLGVIVTYDVRMQRAAERFRVRVLAPRASCEAQLPRRLPDERIGTAEGRSR